MSVTTHTGDRVRGVADVVDLGPEQVGTTVAGSGLDLVGRGGSFGLTGLSGKGSP